IKRASYYLYSDSKVRYSAEVQMTNGRILSKNHKYTLIKKQFWKIMPIEFCAKLQQSSLEFPSLIKYIITLFLAFYNVISVNKLFSTI
ncbi:MAG: hypothetical protein UCN61_06955, partial [Ruminococcus sp.]|nr:hypothetical protein [Ruminococcus sp.]